MAHKSARHLEMKTKLNLVRYIDEIRVVGANNLVRVEHAKPKNVRILGAGSSVVQAGKDR
jgi:hypothetical protein